ncbi:MAG: pitrilysin family protein [Hyphomicrobiales bacterium]|nr:pitrilysin family protein [Hyphomicrobiales bacterium]
MTRFFAKRLKSASGLFVAALLVVGALPAAADVAIQKVTSDKGITAWLVEDYSVPIVAISFSFSGGNTQDPPGKEGLSELMTGLFDEGAGDLDSEGFQVKLDEAGAEMRFGAGRDTIYGSMRMLAEKTDDALGLLQLAVEKPRFDAAPVDRIRSQMVAGIVASAKDPDTEAQVKWAEALYGVHPYARPDEGTEKSLATITSDDLRAYHKAVFARDTLKVAVVGAIDAETLKRKLDELFGDLPAQSKLRSVTDVDLKLDQEIRVDYDLSQTSLQLAYPGVSRDAPDFFAAYLMNHILGGGTFTSRLFDEVREKRGLAYSVSSSLVTNKYSSGLVISTGTRSDRAPETLKVVRDVVRRMAEEGPTEAELAAAKKYVIGSYALNNLDSSTAIAATLLSLQEQDLGIDYMQRREALIDAVTLEQVKAAGRKLLVAEPAVLVVGPAFKESNG